MEEDFDGGGKKVFPEGEAYLSMIVDPGEAIAETRANADDPGLVDELKIHSVRMVLYDGSAGVAEDDRQAEYVFEFDITSNSWGATGTPSPVDWVSGTTYEEGSIDENGVITPDGQHLFKQVSGKYQFITFAQKIKAKDYKMLVILNGKSFGTTPSPIYNITQKGNTYGTFKLAMDMHVDPATGALDFGNRGIVMTNHQGLIDVPKNALSTTQDNANGTPVAVAVDRMLAKVTVGHTADFLANMPEGLVLEGWKLDVTNKKTYAMRKILEGENIQTGTYTMQDLYAEDPNYTLLTGSATDNNFNSVYTNGHLQSTQVTNSFNEWEYTLENTMGVADKSQMTQIVVGYTYNPPGLPANSSYYVYKNEIIVQDAMDVYRTAPDDSKIPFYLSGLYEVLKVINTDDYKLDGTSTEYYEIDGLQFCPQGKLYYSIPIRHFEVAANALGYYGVVRNNMYKVMINKVNPPGVGSPSLSADIHIIPWGRRNQTSVIGIRTNEEGDKNPTVKIYYKSLSDKDPNSPEEPLNLYPLWFENAYPTMMPVPDCSEFKRSTGSFLDLNGGTIYRKDLSSLDHYFYMSVPEGVITVQPNSADNVVTIYYGKSTAGVGVVGTANVYFVDENEVLNPSPSLSNPLKVYYKNSQSNTTLGNTLQTGILDDDIYVKVLEEAYIFKDNDGNPYKIKATDYVRKYEGNTLLTDYFEDPVKAVIGWSGNTPELYTIYVLCVRE